MIDDSYVLRIVEDIQRSKGGMEPDYALMREISTRIIGDVKSSLNGMVGSGVLGWHRTMNDVAFEITGRDGD